MFSICQLRRCEDISDEIKVYSTIIKSCLWPWINDFIVTILWQGNHFPLLWKYCIIFLSIEWAFFYNFKSPCIIFTIYMLLYIFRFSECGPNCFFQLSIQRFHILICILVDILKGDWTTLPWILTADIWCRTVYLFHTLLLCLFVVTHILSYPNCFGYNILFDF